MKNLIDLRYPIGHFEYGNVYTLDDTRKHIKTIASLPKNIKKLSKNSKVVNSTNLTARMAGQPDKLFTTWQTAI